MAENRPQGRQKKVEDGGLGVKKRGSGLGTGPVGSRPSSGAGKPSSGAGKPSSISGASKPGGSSRGGKSSGGLLKIIIIAAVLLLGGGSGLSGLLGGSELGGLLGGSGSGSQNQELFQQVQNIFTNGTVQESQSWTSASGSNNGKLDKTVSSNARDKFTKIKGNGKDTVTLMIYMCGADLESQGGMATSDLQEMAAAKSSNKLNIIVMTGGSKNWHIKGISNTKNQIYQLKDGALVQLVADAGSGAMTNPDTLESFLDFCGEHYPANRNMLVFWDHGGGSLTGYGYDERKQSAGSMNLGGINKALKASKLKFDFIGFDTCLMGTAENAAMLSSHADYMIASEELEPGVGWYYTNWINDLSENTSVSTLTLGKTICDDFVSECAKSCKGQNTTLSVVDLSEISESLGDALSAFASSTKKLITDGKYSQVSSARSNSREFASGKNIDHIDLVHFANNVGTKDAKNLAKTLLSAVKYNKTNMTNAYGLSIYFPYRKATGDMLNTAEETYDSIGLDDEYSECIREFAGMAGAGQAALGGSGSPFAILEQFMSGTASGSYSGSFAMQGVGDISQLLQLFLQNGGANLLTGRSLDMAQTAEYIAKNQLDASQLVWTLDSKSGNHVLVLDQSQWDLVQDIDLNMFYDDGEGFIDLGFDNTYEFDDYGNLIGDTDGTWLSINKQPVAYYRTSSFVDGDSYIITGRVPALLTCNHKDKTSSQGQLEAKKKDLKLVRQLVDLELVFTNEEPYGFIAGARMVYDDETDAEAKGLIELEPGDTLEFICDYYDYNGNYMDSYFLGDPMKLGENPEISNTYVGDNIITLYRVTDIYNQQYWTEPAPARVF